MRTLSASSVLRLVAAFLAVFLGLGLFTAGSASAVEAPQNVEGGLNADEMKRLAGLPQDQRDGIRDQLNQELAKNACKPNPMSALLLGQDCTALSEAAFGQFLTTPEQSLDYDVATQQDTFCAALAQQGASNPAVIACAVDSAWKEFQPVLGPALRTAISLQPGGLFVLGAADTVAFIANAKDGFEKFANSTKEGAVQATNEVLNNLLKVSSFEVNDSFRDLWAVFAGVGVVIMALMYLKLFKDVADEKIDFDTARQSIFWYGPLSMVLVLFGPALGYVINGWLMQVTGSMTFWTSNQITDFATAISRFASYESNGAFGPLAAVLLFGLMFLGAWALLGLFALQPFALYMLGVGLALMVGFLIHPEYRAKVSKTAALWVSIALSKPLILLLMGALFSFISSRPAFQAEGVNDALINASSVFLAAAAMLVLAFSPAALFKFVPILPSSATGYGADRPSIAGAAMVAGTGAALKSMISNRRISQNQSGSGSSSGGGFGSGASGKANGSNALAGSNAGGGTGGGGSIGTSTGTGTGTGGGQTASQPGSRVMNRQAPADTGSNGQGSGSGSAGAESVEGAAGGSDGASGGAQDTRTIAQMQRDERAGTPAGKAGQALRTGTGAAGRGTAAVGRGSAKIAAGGATAFLLAGREGARQASMRGRQGAKSIVPNTDHISGR